MSVLKVLSSTFSNAAKCKKLQLYQTRGLFRILNQITNRPNKERIKEVGPDRSCAEWLLRCGATFRWMESDRWEKDYNSLPPVTSNMKAFHIEEVDANEATLMDVGFDHFDGCRHVKRIRFKHCPYLMDSTLAMLIKLKDSLEHLELSSCGDITEEGLASLVNLRLLKTLLLFELVEVRNKRKIYTMLTQGLPQCQITYKDLDMETLHTKR